MNVPDEAKAFPSLGMMLKASATLREVLDESADVHDFQGRADQFLEAVRIWVDSVHFLHARRNDDVGW